MSTLSRFGLRMTGNAVLLYFFTILVSQLLGSNCAPYEHLGFTACTGLRESILPLVVLIAPTILSIAILVGVIGLSLAGLGLLFPRRHSVLWFRADTAGEASGVFRIVVAEAPINAQLKVAAKPAEPVEVLTGIEDEVRVVGGQMTWPTMIHREAEPGDEVPVLPNPSLAQIIRNQTGPVWPLWR
ncbi:MAG: hypothetical protein ABIP74_02760 [Candidatus Saccharimonas sp.]